mmetsp:Transcript_20721/g.26776  ORF Transcript_20721/g.26776 Transcript_20721/m.26776 type:complete len:139 (+) Transcript_20721:53-469(+)
MDAQTQNTETQPTTAIVVLGEAMHFKPEAQVISIKLLQREQFRDALEHMAAPDSLEAMHVVIQTKDFMNLYDADAIPEFMPCLKKDADFMVHIVAGENEQVSEEQLDDVKASLVMAGLRFNGVNYGGIGSMLIAGKKP